MGSESKIKEKRRASSSGDEGERKRRKTSDKEEKTHKSKAKHRSQDSSKHKSTSKQTKSNDDKHKKHDTKSESKFVIKEISVDDYFSKNNEFSTWLKEKKDVFFSDLSSESARDMFSKFVKMWNKQKLDSRYYEGSITAAPRSNHKWNIRSTLYMAKSSADDKILSYNDVVLRRSDLTILNGPHFLNDRIIEFYFSYLASSQPSDKISLIPPTIPFWVMNCSDPEMVKEFLQPLNLHSKNLVLFPVNDNDDVTKAEGGSHWSLLAFYRGKKGNVFVHHDSYGGSNARFAKRLYGALVPYMGISSGTYIECLTSPQQVNGYDCGLYVVAIAKAICCWFEGGEAVGDGGLWFSYMAEVVSPVAVSRMRGEILRLIQSLGGSM